MGLIGILWDLRHLADTAAARSGVAAGGWMSHTALRTALRIASRMRYGLEANKIS